MKSAFDAERENISKTSTQARIIDIPKNTVANNLKLKLKEWDEKIKELETKVHGLKSELENKNIQLTQLQRGKRTYYPACQKCALR